VFRFLKSWKQRLIDLLEVPQLLREIRSGVANQSDDFARGLAQVKDEIEMLDERLINMAQGASKAFENIQHGSFEINPIVEIPFGVVDLNGSDPILAVMQTAEFAAATKFFAESHSAARSLVSPQSQALLYNLIRLLKPEWVVEIGTFMAASTEAMARALLANGSGILDTIDPFGAKRVRPIFAAWPPELRKTTIFHAVNSMQFFAETRRRQADLIFIDGNHDFEFALFDIESAARFLRPNGFIVIDNIGQPGPFMASRDFLARHRGWREHGDTLVRVNQRAPYDPHRSKIKDTDFCVLEAPPSIIVDRRAMTPGEMPFTSPLGGIQIELANPSAGTLRVQCVVRTFGSPPKEFRVENSIEIKGGQMAIRIPIEVTSTEAPDVRQTVEPWLVWEGSEALRLSSPPKIF